MKCVVGIDLGSTTTKALLLTEDREVLGRGITNSRSSYDVACAVAREEALTAARFALLERRLAALPGDTRASWEAGTDGSAAGNGSDRRSLEDLLQEAFRLELYLDELGRLREEIVRLLESPFQEEWRAALEPAVEE
ncbi:MAG: BadF/BadG/BcrA/BcrD ATPase family protein, partial [Acidobacteriota bacterium]